MMENSILNNIKQLLGIQIEVTAFDLDIKLAINSAFMELNQLGLGPDGGYSINGASELWNNFIGESINLDAVKTFVYLKTRLVFDPPSTSFQIEAIERQLTELSWRLNVQKESTV